MLAPWLGGASAIAAATATGGRRGMLAPWIGGASAVAASPAIAGRRSMLAFWLGGASGYEATAPLPAPAPSGGYIAPRRFRIKPTDDEDEVMLLIHIALQVMESQ